MMNGEEGVQIHEKQSKVAYFRGCDAAEKYKLNKTGSKISTRDRRILLYWNMLSFRNTSSANTLSIGYIMTDYLSDLFIQLVLFW